METTHIQPLPPLISRYFTNTAPDPYAAITWATRTAEIKDFNSGEIIFRQEDMEFPEPWSDTAVKVVAQKYFKGKLNTPDRETSVRQLVGRVVNTITDWGVADGYFNEEEAEVFRDELAYLMLTQAGCFNSPVWFNVGVPNTNGHWCWNATKKKAVQAKDDEHKPQVSACFILSIEDDMDSILRWYVEEGRIFSNGSGAGVNLSPLRGSMEHLSGGGMASGPVTFMRPADANAGTIKSGGKTRRAAKMVILNVDHPDIEDFITCKAKQEKIARDLIALGYDGGFNAAEGAYGIVTFQNANNSVRATDEFMKAVQKGGDYWTKLVHTGERHKKYKARDLFRMIAEATHYCGDPGMQFHDTTNEWNICADTEPIVASNPCSEYMFLVDTACNLASLNLMKFIDLDGTFQVDKFRRAVHTVTLAQEILVDNGGYPTEKMALRSHQYRPLGLGYANLGALLMSRGIAYDSEAGRSLAAEITAIMTGQAYLTSTQIAAKMGPFPMWEKNRKSGLKVLLKHDEAANSLHQFSAEARSIWSQVIEAAEKYGIRNAQTTVLAPTGTISFMMDCATTGIEPELNLVKYKTLVGGGTLKMVNPIVREALGSLGYTEQAAERIASYVEANGTVEGSGIALDQLPVFDTSLPAGPSRRSIHYMGHIRMMAAVQPFLSGAISKTVNMPNNATVEEIMEAYQTAWEMGLKSVAIYRDGSKGSQPLSTKQDNKVSVALPGAHQRKLTGDRNGIIHEFRLNGHKGFLTVGLYEDGTPGEIFLDIAKEGSTISGLMDTIAILTSFCLQYGVPLQKLVDKFRAMSFEPSGFTGIPEIGYAKSLPDYIFRWLELKFLPKTTDTTAVVVEPAPAAIAAPADDTPTCSECGWLMVPSGTCFKCSNCGGTSGCS
jgi:ribonucleoside-diphosphate reductase alpha chain